ncbi:hypothetical protein ACQP1W_36920 [Spirillospora sp. CA-255316]
MIELLFLGSAAFAGGAHAMRRSRRGTRQQPRARAKRDSLVVKAWNSSGAPHTDETMLADALADLGGRAIGTTIRRRRQAARTRSQQRRQRGGDQETPMIVRRRNRATDTGTGTGNEGGGDERRPDGAAGRRREDAPPLPLPPGRRQAAPRSPIPMPPGPPPAGATGRTPARTGSGGRGRGRSPARRGRGTRRRARARMRVAVPLNLEAPDTDVEFLDACADLQQMLRGIGVAVEEWNEDLAKHRLPSVVTGPLDSVHEGLVDGAACTALATVLFENWFAEAREIAAAGIEFTGDDPE